MAVKKVKIQTHMVRFLAFIMLVIIILVGRIAWIQFVDGKRMTSKIEMQLKESKTLHSPRGTIYDRNGRELAVSGRTQSLYVNPAEVNDPDMITNILAPVLNMKPEDIKGKIATGGQFVWIKRMLEQDNAKKIQEAIKENNIKGLGFIEESKRYYPNDTLAAQVLGFVGTDDIGLDGVEMVLDKNIKQKPFEQVIDTDSHGIPIFKSIFNFSPPKQAQNVYLTIDSTIQFIVEQSLDKAIKSTGSHAGIVIVMNPHTGEILAMANRPTYNPNEFYKYSDNDWKNRAVSYNYEPGSTFKSVVAAAALQEGKVTPNETFVDKGYEEVSGRLIHNWSGDGYGTISFTKIIEESINTGFVQIGMRLGGQKLTEYAKAFGFGKTTGIELPGEEAGLLFDPKEMRDSDTATMSIGQSIAVTPIQLITAVGAIANQGMLLQPHIIKEIRNVDGSIEKEVKTQSIKQVITPETATTLANLMEKVISEGGGKKAAIKGYRLAGKTGTAEKLKESGDGYANGRYVASFVGFGPVEDPQVVILVVLDDPTGVYYGGQIAAPAAGEMLSQIMRYLNIRPSVTSETTIPKPSQQTVVRNDQTTTPTPNGKVVVPNVLGMSIREAGIMLNKLGLAIVPIGTGMAVKQSIPASTVVETGAEVTVYFGG